MNLSNLDIHTVDGTVYTGVRSAKLAYQIWLRFGRDLGGALAAWRRMLQNNCPDESFAKRVAAGELLTRHDDLGYDSNVFSRRDFEALDDAIASL